LDIARFTSGSTPTELVFLEDSYSTKFEATVLKSFREKHRAYICLDKTLFHPRMGGQPNDEGFIEYMNGSIHVTKAFINNGVVVHIGSILYGDIPREGVTVYGKIDWIKRYKIMRRHTAGHLLDYCISRILDRSIRTIDLWMGDPCYTVYDTRISLEDIARIEYEASKIIESDRNVYFTYIDHYELQQRYPDAPNLYRLPMGLNRYRIVVIDGCNSIPCTGTHVRRLSEIGCIKIDRIEYTTEGYSKLYYDVYP